MTTFEVRRLSGYRVKYKRSYYDPVIPWSHVGYSKQPENGNVVQQSRWKCFYAWIGRVHSFRINNGVQVQITPCKRTRRHRLTMHFTSEKKAAYRASQRDCIIAAKQHRLFFMANIHVSMQAFSQTTCIRNTMGIHRLFHFHTVVKYSTYTTSLSASFY